MGKISPVAKQFLTVACCNLLTLSFGLSTGWATINLLELENKNSTFSTGPLTKQETSLVIAIMNVGGFTGNWLVIPLGTLVGLKRAIHMLGIPIVLSSILTIYAQNVYYLYVARLFIGIVGGGMGVLISSLINDISNNNYRGALNCVYDPMCNIGIIISYFLGNILSCVDQAKIQLIPPAIFFVVLFFLPESPEYWSKRNKLKKANKSLSFYKGSLAVLDKLEKSEFLPVPQNEKDVRIVQKSYEPDMDDDLSPLSWKDFCTPHAKRAFLITIPSLFLSLFTGVLSITSFTTFIFNETGSSLSEKDSSILVSIITLTANIVTLNIVERFNRRTLYLFSSICTMVSYFLFGAYGFFWKGTPGFEWMNSMPLLCFASVIFFSWLGIVQIPYIINIEISPKKIRQTNIALVISIIWTVLFAYGIVFYTFVEEFGLYTVMIILGLFSFLTGVFGYFFVPETRGKSYEEIRELMTK